MTVRDLMEILEMFDEDAEVKLAYQPSWPLCTAVASVKKKDGVVYVCESGYGGNDYAPPASSKATSTSTLTKAQRKKSNLPNRPPDDGPVAPGRNAPSVAGSPQYL